MLILAAAMLSPRLLAQPVDRVERLIRDLGDEAYEIRAAAYEQLRHGDVDVLSALRRASSSEDLEVRRQARRLLELVQSATRLKRLTAFLEGDPQVELAGWKCVQQLWGDDAASRRLFVDLLQAEPELWRRSEEELPALVEALKCRCGEVAGTNDYRRRRRADGETTCSLLVFASLADAPVEYQTNFVIYNLASHGSLDDMLQHAQRGPLVKQLLRRWVEQGHENAAILRFQLGYHYELAETLAPAIQLIRLRRENYIHHKAMLVVAAHGRREHIADVAPYLDDETILFKRPQTGYTCQARDAALLAAALLSGRQAADFGFDHLQPNEFHRYEYNSIGFSDPARRAAALEKWRQLQTAEPAPKPASQSPPGPR